MTHYNDSFAFGKTNSALLASRIGATFCYTSARRGGGEGPDIFRNSVHPQPWQVLPFPVPVSPV